MSIKYIVEEIWPEILRLQAGAYFEIEPESLETLRSKWLASPELCFVHEANKEITGYMLAHRWSSLDPPELFQPLQECTDGKYLFIHDLVVNKKYSGKGIGQKLVNHLFSNSSLHGFDKAILVSVQSTTGFWSKLKFNAIKGGKVGSCCGENAVIMQRAIKS